MQFEDLGLGLVPLVHAFSLSEGLRSSLDTIHQHTPFFALYVAARARLLDSKLIVQGFPHEGFARSKQAPVARRIDPVNFD